MNTLRTIADTSFLMFSLAVLILILVLLAPHWSRFTPTQAWLTAAFLAKVAIGLPIAAAQLVHNKRVDW